MKNISPTSPKAKFNEVVCRRPSFTRSLSSNTKSRFFSRKLANHHRAHALATLVLQKSTINHTKNRRKSCQEQLSKEHLSFECASSRFWTCQPRVLSEYYSESDANDVAFIMIFFKISPVPSKKTMHFFWILASTWQLWSGISPWNVH